MKQGKKKSNATKFASLVIGCVLLVNLAGCSGGKQPATESTSSSIKPVQTTTITFWNRYPELDLTNLITGFEKEHPDIKVKLTNVSVEAAPAQYQAAVSQNSLPDLFSTVTSVNLQQLVKLNLVRPLDDFLTADVKNQFYPGTFTANNTNMNGNTYVFPLYSPNHATYVLYYNKDVLKKYGISESNIPKSWDDLKKVGQTIYQKSNGSVYGLMASNDTWALKNIVNQLATTISPNTPLDIDYKTGKPSFNTTGDVETIQYLKSLLDEHVMAPQSLESNESNATALFAAGQAAFYMMGNWEGSNLVNTVHFTNWGVSPLPTKNGQPFYHTSGGANGIEVSNNTKNLPQVKTFLQYCLDHVYSEVVVAPGSTEPAKKGVTESAKLPFPQYADINKIIDASSLPVPNVYSKNPKAAEFINTYNSQLNKINIGDVTHGYMTGQIKDLQGQLDKINTDANNIFTKLLSGNNDVKAEDFQFNDWTPFTAYTKNN